MNYLIALMLLGCETKITSSIEKDQYIDKVEDTAEVESLDDSEIPEANQEETGETEEQIEQSEDVDSITDFLQRGPYEVTEDSRSAQVTNCTNQPYSVYTPNGITNPPVVILGHGFARGADSMTGWADHLSSWGVEVLLPTMCHYNVFAGVDHEMNGQNMKELAVLHGATNVVYAGHSAGGLAAIIAASQDPQSSGVLGLDATDTKDIPGIPDFIGQQYAANVSCKAYSIMGESSQCNSENNGLDLFQLMNDHSIIKVVGADHCDFENPTDWICESQCENQSAEFTDEEITAVITTLGTAAIMSLTGLSGDGTIIWTDGIDEWKTAGIIQEIE